MCFVKLFLTITITIIFKTTLLLMIKNKIYINLNNFKVIPSIGLHLLIPDTIRVIPSTFFSLKNCGIAVGTSIRNNFFCKFDNNCVIQLKELFLSLNSIGIEF